MTDFTHLHLHTTYSFLDGMVRPKALAKRCVELGLSACAVTDHRHLGAAIGVYKALKDVGVRPILGMEADVKPMHGGQGTHHLIVLARTNQGYDNLRQLATLQQHGPLDLDSLVYNHVGLTFLTSCVAGEVPGLVARGHMDRAREVLDRLVSAVGPRRVCIELQPTAGPHLRANAGLQKLAQDAGLRCVVTNDVHYLRAEDHRAQNVLMALRQGKRIGDKGLHQHPEPVYFLRSGDEMKLACLKAGIDPSHISTTMEVGEECQVELSLGKPDLPPYSRDDDETLLNTSLGGLAGRERQTGVKMLGTEYEDRLYFELGVIKDMGYSGYFLIVQDFVGWARENGCAVGPGRGSGAGSLVAYALGITDLDPIVHKLFFERFLNPERVSMPDFDIDFMQARRGEVIDYVVERWGQDHVGQIATYMALHPKSAIKDVARAQGLSYAEVNELTKGIPANLKAHTPEEEEMSEWELAMVYAPELMALAETDEEYAQLLAVARQLTGCYRQTGKHAGGVVIGRQKLTAYTPLTEDGRTQYDMNDVEQAGLVKFDFLGLKTLDVIQKASDETSVDIRSLKLDDVDVYKMIADGNTWGLFQVESPGMTTMCKELAPDRFDDIVAAVALYRPGPMDSGMLASFIKRKHGWEAVEYAHKNLKTVLADTYGTIVYQEQVMQAAQALAGYTLGGADLLRRAMGKKKPEEMARQRGVWMDGCRGQGIDDELAEELFDAIEKFAGYGFNRSHAAAYALITYQTAWLKLHHPLSFTAALFTVEGGDQDKLAHYVRCARNSKIDVLGPDVNLSATEFQVEGQSVRWGLGSIKGLGPALIPPLVAGQPYTDLYDMAERSGLPRSALKLLINAGACDRFAANRASLLAATDSAVKRGKKTAASEVSGQTSMFANGVETQVSYPVVQRRPRAPELEAERQALGSYVSDHPAAGLNVSRPGDFFDDNELTGVIVDVFSKRSRAGRMWAKVTIEDRDASMKVLVFPDAYEEMGEQMKMGHMVTFYGRVKQDSGEFVAGGCDVH